MNKRGINRVISMTLLVLMAIILIVLLWFIIKFFLKIETEKADARSQLLIEDINIKDFSPVPEEPQTYSILLERGPSKEVLISKEVVVKIEQKNADIISVVDLSASMSFFCLGKPSITCCSQQFDYPICNGRCSESSVSCKNCGGNPNSDPLGSAKKANTILIDEVLKPKKELNAQPPTEKGTTGNRVGLVGYSDKVEAKDVYPLSETSEILFPKNQLQNPNTCHNYIFPEDGDYFISAGLKYVIDKWKLGGGTCIYCGINSAKNELISNSDSSKIRLMIVMSDGAATIGKNNVANNAIASQDAIDEACEAYNKHGILVSTVGFGPKADEKTLNDIAKCGHGTYTFSSLSELPETYSRISEQIIEKYASALKVNHIKMIFYSDTNSYEYQTEKIPKPLESYKYVVQIPSEALEGEIKGVRVYMSVITPSGKEVISPVLDNKIIA